MSRLLIPLLLVIGCDDGGTATVDAHVSDALISDVSVSDAAGKDATVLDAAPPDAAPGDLGATPLDAHVMDAAPPAPDVGPPSPWPTCPEVEFSPPPPGLDPFYTRHVDLQGVPLIGSDGVPDEAFRVASYLVRVVLHARPCLRDGLARNRIRLGILARDEVATDMPEYSDFYEAFPGVDWDNRGRGFGATQERPLTTAAVDNLLRDADDPWLGEQILIHEIAHTLFEVGVEDQIGGDTLRVRLNRIYAETLQAGRWADTYAATNANEYWAEGVQSWFDDNLSADPPDGVHGPIDTREELAAYDPELHRLIAEILPMDRWPTWCDPHGRAPPPAVLPTIGPGEGCGWRVAIPPARACEEAGATRSVASDAAAEIVFVNRRLEPVDLWWIDFDGQRQPFGRIGPRQRMGLRSFATHPWLFTDADGACLHFAVTEAGANRILVE